MRKNKIGSIFLISVLALAGIGISYAGFTDMITVYGEVNTATVELELKAYSGTIVYKIWGDGPKPDLPDQWPVEQYCLDEEILILKGFMSKMPRPDYVENYINTQSGGNVQAEVVSSALASESDDATNEVIISYHNLFPCIDFTADFVFHYTGSIPAKLWADYEITNDEDDLFAMLLAAGEITLVAYECEPDNNGGWIINYTAPVDIGHQVHNCDHIYVALTIHIPQDNAYQGLSGSFSAWIGAGQWNETPEQLWPKST